MPSLLQLLLQRFQAPPAPRKLEERLEELDRAVTSIRLEWQETLDKVEHWMQRTSARVRAAEGGAPGGETASTAPAGPSIGADPISRELRARRGRGGFPFGQPEEDGEVADAVPIQGRKTSR